MSVATKNPFALLDDDSSRPSSPAPTPASAPAAAPAPSAPTRGSAQRSRGGPASRGGRYYARGGKTGPREETAADESAPVDNTKRKFEGEGRGRGRGERSRGGRGGGGGGGGGRGRGRPFDRQSQTGRTDTDKKVNSGWGADSGNAELQAEEAATVDATVEAATTNDWAGEGAAPANDWATGDAAPAAADDPWGSSGAPAGDDATNAVAAEGDKPREGRRGRDREPEEEDNTLTLEQYLQQKKEKEESLVPKLEARRANEGADDWKDVVPLKKGEQEDAYFVGKSKAAPKARAKKEEKVFLEIDARFERPSRGGRGGRGGDRGGERGARGSRGRGAGRGRGGANGSAPVNVDDETAFPSLS